MMAEHEEVTIASAVVVPSTESPDRPKSKRRISATSPEVSKRPKFNSSGDVTAGADSAAADGDDKRRIDRRRRMEEQERQRGQRLFGALLGTIGKFQQDSQSARAKAGANKRKEIEQKLQQKLKQQTEELDEKKRKESDTLMVKKKAEYKAFEVRSLRLKHEYLRDRANFLCTKASPPLYYLPWKLTKDDEDRIRTQKEEVEMTVERELAEFEQKSRQEEEEGIKEEEESEPLNQVNDETFDNGGHNGDSYSTNHHNEDSKVEQMSQSTQVNDENSDEQGGDVTMHESEDDKAASPVPQAAKDLVNPSNDTSTTNVRNNDEATIVPNTEED